MIGWTMALAVLLIAHPKPPSNSAVGTAVVELTYANPPRTVRQQWNGNLGHSQRVLAPLVVMDVTRQARADSGYLIGMEEVARWEEEHGHVPANSVVMARSEAPTRWRSQPAAGNAGHFPGFSEDAIRFLVEARYVYGLGTETADSGRAVVLVYRGTK
jgi:hypothetical protein